MDNFSQSLEYMGTGTGAYRTPKAAETRFNSGVYDGLPLYDKRPISATSPVVRQTREPTEIIEIPVIREVPASYNVERREHQPIPVRYATYEVYEPAEIESFDFQPPIVVSGRKHLSKRGRSYRRSVHFNPEPAVTYQTVPAPSQFVENYSDDRFNEQFFSKNPNIRHSHNINRRLQTAQAVNALRSSLPDQTVKGSGPHDMFLPDDVRMLYLDPEMIKNDFKAKVDLDCDQVYIA